MSIITNVSSRNCGASAVYNKARHLKGIAAGSNHVQTSKLFTTTHLHMNLSNIPHHLPDVHFPRQFPKKYPPLDSSTAQPAGTIPPPPLGWCLHTHNISTRNQQAQYHHLHSDGVSIHTTYQHATSRHNTTTSTRMVSPYTQHINTQLSTFNFISTLHFNIDFKFT